LSIKWCPNILQVIAVCARPVSDQKGDDENFFENIEIPKTDHHFTWQILPPLSVKVWLVITLLEWMLDCYIFFIASDVDVHVCVAQHCQYGLGQYTSVNKITFSYNDFQDSVRTPLISKHFWESEVYSADPFVCNIFTISFMNNKTEWTLKKESIFHIAILYSAYNERYFLKSIISRF